MSKAVMVAATLLACAATLSSKDKSSKVTFHDMALGMRDAFNCGLIVDQHLHGRLKDDAEAYHHERASNHCDHVEEVLNTLDDKDGAVQQ